MTTLPRSYWCHRDFDGPGRGRLELQSMTTPYPGRAVTWMRESVRDALTGLDRPTFGIAWAWLGNHQASGAAIRELRQGRPYTFTLPAPDGHWTWSAHPVSVLPVIETCANAPSSRQQLVPAHANGDPP
ncbi:hypothetical protein HEK616_09940 [Streptomyces nigrescens]|uniref:Uncharacterized protein n=1 Tax=Streptomyces nigrescens TaxID=1920 RepID=A0ABM7ZM73_STRNI|nr:hypothetical protein HEK616_09940 [Streptomyces nigrescens]